MARFVVITSGKGGVGKTTVALNLAVALSNFGREVIVLDANFLSPHVGLKLGYTNFRVTLHHAMKGTNSIKEAIYKHQSGIKVVPSSIALEHMEHVDINRLKQILPELNNEAEIILIDTSNGINRVTQELVKNVNDLIIVTTPEITAVADALKTVKLAKKSRVNILGVIVNKFTGDELEMDIESIQSILELPILAVIPEHVHVKEALKMKLPVVYSHPTSPVTENFKMLAGDMIGEKYEINEREVDEGLTSILDKLNMQYLKTKVQEVKRNFKKKYTKNASKEQA